MSLDSLLQIELDLRQSAAGVPRADIPSRKNRLEPTNWIPRYRRYLRPI